MTDRVSLRPGGHMERLTQELESAVRSGRTDGLLALTSTSASGHGRAARLTTAVSALAQGMEHAREHERRSASFAAQGLREVLTAIRAHMQVLQQVPELPQQARTALLADLDGEVARLSERLDAFAASIDRTG
ncbi:hypothetical protein [Streptacidiphilus sp. PAMC 29251]